MYVRSYAFISNAAPILYPNPVPLSWYPLLLSTNAKLLTYLYVCVDDFLGMDQGPTHWIRHVCHTLFHDLYKFSDSWKVWTHLGGRNSYSSRNFMQVTAPDAAPILYPNPVPLSWYPLLLSTNAKLLTYLYVCVDDFL